MGWVMYGGTLCMGRSCMGGHSVWGDTLYVIVAQLIGRTAVTY